MSNAGIQHAVHDCSDVPHNHKVKEASKNKQS